jgi:hypothetical protein
VNWQRWENYAHLIVSACPCEWVWTGKVRFLRVQKKEPEEKLRNKTEFRDKCPGNKLIVNKIGWYGHILTLRITALVMCFDSLLPCIHISRFCHYGMVVINMHELCKKFVCLWHALGVMRLSYLFAKL